MAYGERDYLYERSEDWPAIPADWSVGHVSGLAVNADGHVLVFSRGDHPVIVLDQDGQVLTSWGSGRFVNPHSIWVGPDGGVYCSDDGNQTISKFSPEGGLLLTIGAESVAPELGRLTGVAVSASGDIYVGDTAHERVVVYSPEGAFRFAWGAPGEGPGEFQDPHFVWVDAGQVWVVDRRNGRLQRFDPEGSYIGEWTDLPRPNAMFIDAGRDVYVSETGAGSGVSIFGADGELKVRWGGEGRAGDVIDFHKPHAIAVDPAGSIYVGENRPHSRPDGTPAVTKFERRKVA